MDIIFFDLETTGTSVTRDRIVQLSAIKTNSNFEILEKKKILVNPKIPIPSSASEVHGITDEMVKDAPAFDRFAKGINDYFQDCILGGYNIKHFDIPLLSVELGRYGFRWPLVFPKIIDCCEVFRDKEKRTLSAAVKFYTGQELEGAHDAENDNLGTIKVLVGQMEKYGMKLNDVTDFCQYLSLDLSEKIILDSSGVAVYNFGKDKGLRILENPGYAKWMLKPEQDFTLDTKNCLRRILGIKEVTG